MTLKPEGLSGAEMRSLLASLSTLRIRDRERLKRRLTQVRSHEDLEKFASEVIRIGKRFPAGDPGRLKIDYPEELPVTHRRREIMEAVRDNPVVIVCGSTGSGKTTQLPKIALELGRGRYGAVGCTQPRRLAATAMARRVAAELDCELGREVGYKVRFDDCTSSGTMVKFMTDGMLLAETSGDPALLDYDTIIIDEAHERGLNIDFLLGYLKNLQRRRHDLKLIISSATLDTGRFSRFFDGAPVVTVEGRAYPVEDMFMPPEDDEDLSSHIARAVEFIDELDNSGDILVFLPGEREIRDACDMLSGRNYRNTEILPLFARLSMGEQQRIFSPGRARRIILATNVAETSVTIPRIHYVIDSGLARISRYNARTGIQELQIEQISRSSARQRRGRCGRIADGVCVYLYDQETLEKAPEFTDPEIKRTGLAGVILQMAMLKLGRIEKFDFVDPPPANLVRDGRRTLNDIGATDDNGRITELGWKLAALPLDPHLGKMLAEASGRGVLAAATVVAAFLSIQDPRERPQEKRQAADQAHAQWRDVDSDFVTAINLWNFLNANSSSRTGLRKLARRNFLNGNRVVEWQNLVNDLWSTMRDEHWKISGEFPADLTDFSVDLLHISLLSGVPRNIGCYDSERGDYRGTGDRRFLLFPGSSLAKQKKCPPWVMTLALVETTRVFARMNAVIRPEFVETAAPHLCTATYDQAAFSPESGFVYARERLVSGGLLINGGRRVHYGAVRPVEARKIFIREGLCEGLAKSRDPQIRAHLGELSALRKMEEKLRRPGTVLDTEAIYEDLMIRLPAEAVSVEALEKILKKTKIFPLDREISMMYQYTPVDFDDYPDELTVSGEKFAVDYTFDPESPADGAVLQVPKNELNLLPSPVVDYAVPGYLREKVELMLRKLPKSRRVVVNPVPDTVSAFMADFKAGKIPVELPLADTLADFLTAMFGENFAASEFCGMELPSWQSLKIAVIGRDGKTLEYLTSLPDAAVNGSRVSGRLARSFARSGGESWPDGGALPEKMALPGNGEVSAYPALKADDAGLVGRQLYLRLDEAMMHHRGGVMALFYLHNSDQVNFVVKQQRYTQSQRLGMFYRDVERLYKTDFKNVLMERALGGDLWSIRSEDDFLRAAEKAKMALGETADNLAAELDFYAEWFDRLTAGIDKFASRSPAGAADARRQLDFLFRPGFLRGGEALNGYPRYLRGLAARLDRLNSNPAKDADKLEAIEPFIDRFSAAVLSVDEIAHYPGLLDFFVLLEELRLSQFSPEIRPKFKVSVAVAQEAWNNLRI
ncbi:MAG: ATP-dependent RNA helicase HrpA [Victivallaceae bacterium]|nr:ATP-dependent RNA helicase HrpA [Victivallaceae bacterium]